MLAASTHTLIFHLVGWVDQKKHMTCSVMTIIWSFYPFEILSSLDSAYISQGSLLYLDILNIQNKKLTNCPDNIIGLVDHKESTWSKNISARWNVHFPFGFHSLDPVIKNVVCSGQCFLSWATQLTFYLLLLSSRQFPVLTLFLLSVKSSDVSFFVIWLSQIITFHLLVVRACYYSKTLIFLFGYM